MSLLNDIEITIKSVQLERKGLDVDFFSQRKRFHVGNVCCFYHLDILLAQFYSFFTQSCRRANHIVPRSPPHNQLNHNDNSNSTASNVGLTEAHLCWRTICSQRSRARTSWHNSFYCTLRHKQDISQLFQIFIPPLPTSCRSNTPVQWGKIRKPTTLLIFLLRVN